MRSPAANQRRRSTRNRRNVQPTTPPNQQPRIVFEPKVKYALSKRTADGVLVLCSRKRAPPTAEERAAKKAKQLEIKTKQVSLVALRHKVISIWQHGMCIAPNFVFGPRKRPKIVEYLQATIPQYANKAAAKSFVQRVVTRFEKKDDAPHLDPFRDCRGENRKSPKRKNPQIVALCDELLSEADMTAPKVVARLAEHGFQISKQTVHNIAKDLCFRWTKPWYTDILTNAQKLKRKIFCRELLRLTPAQLLNRIGQWLWTDEKWWDIVGPGKSRYIKALSQFEAKLLNQVNIIISHFCMSCLCLLFHECFACIQIFQVKRHKSKKGGVKRRVYFWGGISWFGKTPGVAWTASDNKVLFRHTKNLCVGTVFEDEGVVFRVVETRALADDGNVSYVEHFRFPDEIPHERYWHYSEHKEVKEWHDESRARLAMREDLQVSKGQGWGLCFVFVCVCRFWKVECEGDIVYFG